DEADPLARNSANEPLFLAVVADRASSGVDPAVQRRVRDDPSSPHQRNEIIPADDAVAVFQQVNQQVEYLRLHRHQIAATVQLTTPATPGNRAGRFTAFLFGGVAYLTFLFTIMYAIGFVSDLAVPKAIDTGAKSGTFEAIAVNLTLMSIFAIQHSVMARKSFKHWWTQFIPRSVERSTYVLSASLTLLLLFWQWRPMPAVIWNIQEPDMAVMIATLSFVGWVIVFTSTFLINHLH